MRLSIVSTLYRSAPYLREFHARAAAAAAAITDDVEFVYVNDGSPDEALDVALALREVCGNVRVVDLSRNFGHHRAMMAGLAHATGPRQSSPIAISPDQTLLVTVNPGVNTITVFKNLDKPKPSRAAEICISTVHP